MIGRGISPASIFRRNLGDHPSPPRHHPRDERRQLPARPEPHEKTPSHRLTQATRLALQANAPWHTPAIRGARVPRRAPRPSISSGSPSGRLLRRPVAGFSAAVDTARHQNRFGHVRPRRFCALSMLEENNQGPSRPAGERAPRRSGNRPLGRRRMPEMEALSTTGLGFGAPRGYRTKCKRLI